MTTPTTPPPDIFSGSPAALDVTSPFVEGFAVSPSDTASLTWLTRALFVGTGGTVKLDLFNCAGVQSTISLGNVPSGTLLWMRVGAVWSTGTGASNIVALR